MQTTALTQRSLQRGVSIVIVLLFLMAISTVTIFSVRKTMLGEGMARNSMDHQIAYQAAEAALRDAERDLLNTSISVLPNASCTRGTGVYPLKGNFPAGVCPEGYCSIANYSTVVWGGAPAEPWWPPAQGGMWNNNFADKPSRLPVDSHNCGVFTGGVPLGTFTGAPAIPNVAIQPEYMIERFDGRIYNNVTPMAYRITARGFGLSTNTQVMLQTFFIPKQ